MNGSGWTVFSAVFVVVLALLGGVYFMLQVYAPPASATAPAVPEVRQFRVYMEAVEAGAEKVHRWSPSAIVVNAGDTVILRVTNTDEGAHGFSLGAMNVAVPSITPGDTVTIRFKATRAGIYHFGCTLVGCAADHADQTGQLVVLGGR